MPPASTPGNGITMVLPSLSLGGMEQVVLAQAKALRAAGREVAIVALLPGGALEAEAKGCGLTVVVPRTRLSLRQAVAFLRDRLSVHPCGILHSHTGAWLPSALASWQLPGVRHVHTRHGFVDGGVSAWISERLGAWLTDHVTCVSEELAAHTRRRFRVPASRITVIRSGIDLAALPFRPGSAPTRTDGFVMVCRLVPVKNVPRALRAVARVRAVVPSVTLDVFGGGPEQPRIESLIRDLGLAGAVTVHGETAHPWTHVAPGSVFVQASDSEGLSLALLEAMAMGLRVIATAVGETAAFTGDLPGVLLVPAEDRGQAGSVLAEAIRTVAEQPLEVAVRLGDLNRAHALRHAGLDQSVASYSALYQRMLKAA
jgi:glycosyltransferase involved in cell wall biosynthesis